MLTFCISRYSSKREIHSFNNAVPFGLLLGSKSEDPTIQVLDWEEASRLDLSVTYNHFDASPSSISSHLVGWLVGDIQKGMEATEKMLEQGQEMTAIGELVRDQTGGGCGKFQIRPPPEKAYYLIRSPVKKLLKELEEEAKVLKWILLVRFVFRTVAVKAANPNIFYTGLWRDRYLHYRHQRLQVLPAVEGR